MNTSTWVNDHHDVRALVNYFPREEMEYDMEALPAPALGGFLPSSRQVTIYNARGKENAFKLDRNGFEFFTLPFKERNASTDEEITGNYYTELGGIMKSM